MGWFSRRTQNSPGTLYVPSRTQKAIAAGLSAVALSPFTGVAMPAAASSFEPSSPLDPAVSELKVATKKASQPHPGVRVVSFTTQGPSQRVHVAEVDVGRSDLAIRATRPGERRQTVSGFAKSVNALVAVNGDFFFPDFQTYSHASGDGKEWPASSKQMKWGLLACNAMDRCTVGRQRKLDAASFENVVGGARRKLVNNGVALTSQQAWTTSLASLNPRTAVGVTQDKKKLILAVVEGRLSGAAGMNHFQMAALMKKFGAHDALMLDGGGSSAMAVNGRLISRPSDGTQRTVANHLAIVLE